MALIRKCGIRRRIVFVRVFNHYKTAHGDGVFWHAENDFIELPLDTGFPCALLMLTADTAMLASKCRFDSPTNAAIIAALVTYAIHSSFEFLSYVPSNLILAERSWPLFSSAPTPHRCQMLNARCSMFNGLP